jgi:hypothetical protein
VENYKISTYVPSCTGAAPVQQASLQKTCCTGAASILLSLAFGLKGFCQKSGKKLKIYTIKDMAQN